MFNASIFFVCIHPDITTRNFVFQTRYSMECMLAFIEMSQFQNYLIQNDREQAITQEVATRIKAENVMGFAKNIPVSEIIESEFNIANVEQILDFKMKAYLIYKKYVELGSEFEINIPSTAKSKFKHVANLSTFLKTNTTINDLVMMFEDCKTEMRLLLMYSLIRFRATEEFEAIEKIFGKNVHEEILIQEMPINNTLIEIY